MQARSGPAQEQANRTWETVPEMVLSSGHRFGGAETTVDGALRLTFAETVERILGTQLRRMDHRGIRADHHHRRPQKAMMNHIELIRRIRGELPFQTLTRAAVIGIPDEWLSQVSKAFVVCKSPVCEPDLIDWCRQRMAGFKAPRHIEFLDVLRLNATGKVMRGEIH